ncbi:sulfur oxidation c-type cytochrome SoxA [Betaproteobacteria bacterium SCN1]|jgi:sulfur-oxidizing protein SoxA|nr:sulfur oxidation c-type cytochrome SoxA [Betaproteobacteria bacterium SCN1]MBN8761528.1 sulfur oxidation c-type cytochrome SoxA [Thiobacillus sp.]ODU88713.1 MAG: sulfur oxidation c-type cytochrome SoxA [Thiobacillus sp. SCN 65-179]OJW39039.1 MAG: sulfur oxidation c-type cytochrome SoxA [Thiobacillus sp. 65-69]
MKQQIVKLLAGMASLGIALGAASVQASPEQDRQDLIKYYTSKYPNVKIEDYVYGALAFDADSKAQYDAIMEFPPFESELDTGRKLWETPFKNGKTYAECLPNGGKMIAGNYPMFDDATGKVVTLEGALNNCRTANGETAYKLGDKKTLGVLTAYMRTLSDGMLMNIKVEGPKAMAAYEDGKKTFYARKGQLNFACANCHVQNAGVRLRSELISPAVGHAVHWPVFRGGDNLVTLQSRYEGCFKQVRAVPPAQGSTTMNDLEYFHSSLSNGLPMKASVFRK